MTPAAESRPWGWAALWLAGLAPFFFLSYGFANWVTSLRYYVPELAFGWERRIPFLAWTIVPYWSTDLFYAASLFLCRTRAELRTHGKRLLAVQLMCVAGFLLVPLRFGFERPHASGLFGWMFDALTSFDKPFNQAPSLHIALIAVLWTVYARHFRGWALRAIEGWFLLMAVSTLTTYQHHFIDLPTGLWVGLFATAVFPDREPRRYAASRDRRRLWVAGAYFLIAAIWGLTAWAGGGAAWILLWPAAAMALVAGIYWSGRAELFRKSDGGMPAAMVGILAPYLAGAWLNSRRGYAPAQEIADGVWLGRRPTATELAASGMASVVDVTAELPFARGGVVYRGIPMLDLLTPGMDQLAAAVAAIRDLDTVRPTLVCCALGYSRSAAVVAAWLIDSGTARSAGEAIESIRDRRPCIVITRSSRALLEAWAERRVKR